MVIAFRGARTVDPGQAPRCWPIHATSSTPNSYLATQPTPLSFAPTRNPSVQVAPGDVTREVTLKAILKKMVKGNKESVWSKMRALQVLDISHHRGCHLIHMISYVLLHIART